MATSQDSSGHLASQSSGAPVLLPCDDSNPEQAWDFGKGIHSPSSLYSVKSGNALGVDSATLFSSAHKYKGGNDPFQVCTAAYKVSGLSRWAPLYPMVLCCRCRPPRTGRRRCRW